MLTTLRSRSRLLMTLLLLLPVTALAQPGQGPPPPAGWVLLDDMYLPASVVFGDSTYTGQPWPNGVVPFVFDPNVTSQNRQRTFIAMAELEAIADVDFVPRAALNPLPSNWVHIQDGSANRSPVGMIGGAQTLEMTSWGVRYIIVHELLHALGFKHEHQRPDRNNFVTINDGSNGTFNNIASVCGTNGTTSCSGNFMLLPSSAQTFGAYDFLSVMHYPGDAFSNGLGNTIVCKPGFAQFQNQMGQRSFMSLLDAQGVAQVYGAPLAPSIIGADPGVVTAGSSPMTLTVTGTRFLRGSTDPDGVQGSIVLIDGTPVPTTYVSPGTLRVTISAALLASPRRITIRVENPAPGGGLSAASTISVVRSATGPDIFSTGIAHDEFGSALAFLGDVDADGVDDFAVGAADLDGPSVDSGAVLVYSGATGGVIHVLTGFQGNGKLGSSLAAIGDVDGDGVTDFCAGGPFHNNNEGYVRVWSGVDGSLIRHHFGVDQGNLLGMSVAGIGDVTGDGVNDYIAGEPGHSGGRGRVRAFSGATGSQLYTVSGLASGDGFGTSVASGGTIDLDGIPDFIVGAPHSDANGSNSGQVRWFSGASGIVINSANGDGANHRFGHAVAGPGPLNDNLPLGDLVASAVPTGGGPTYVRAFDGTGTVLWTRSGASGTKFGDALIPAGDLDEDGRPDVLIGVPNAGSGEVLAVSGMTGEDLWVMTNPSVSFNFGSALATGGDLDGNGHHDFLVAGTVTTGTSLVQRVDRPLPKNPRKVLITEVTWGNPDAVEITNFSTSSVDLSHWSLSWDDGTTKDSSSFPFGTVLAPGEIVIVKEPGGAALTETPAGIRVFELFPALPTTSHDITVGLRTFHRVIIDEVRVSDTNGDHDEGSLGGRFRGLAMRGTITTAGNAHGVERIWGLDSDSGADWTEQPNRSLGLENRSSGPRGTDPMPVANVLITEIDDNPDYIELRNLSGTVDLRGWTFLCSSQQETPHAIIKPFPESRIIVGPGFLVIGDLATQPAELPVGVPYVALNSVLGGNIPWTNQKYDCALYDVYGRLVDLVRTTGATGNAVHNHPRAPSSWDAFSGSAARGPAGAGSSGAIARRSTIDNNNGGEWTPAFTRTMGSTNPTLAPQLAGNATSFDVRLNGTPTGAGITAIMNAGPAYAGYRWSFTYSLNHLDGNGPFFGLGADALTNYLQLSQTPPWFGTLDAQGSARLDFPSGSIPPGVDTDDMFILQDPAGNIVRVTDVLEFDS